MSALDVWHREALGEVTEVTEQRLQALEQTCAELSTHVLNLAALVETQQADIVGLVAKLTTVMEQHAAALGEVNKRAEHGEHCMQQLATAIEELAHGCERLDKRITRQLVEAV